MRKKLQKHKTQWEGMAVAEAEEDIEETTDIKDIQVKDIEAANDMEMRIWRMVMKIQKQTIYSRM